MTSLQIVCVCAEQEKKHLPEARRRGTVIGHASHRMSSDSLAGSADTVSAGSPAAARRKAKKAMLVSVGLPLCLILLKIESHLVLATHCQGHGV